jgi:hypothetical protein
LSDWSDLRSINFKTPKVFLSQPFNGASFPNPPITSPWNDTITFNWISISDATSYWLQLSTDSNFLSNIFSGGNGVWTSSTHYDLVFNMFTYNNQRIFWRVCANFSGGTSSKWSEIRNISIGTVTGVEEHKSKTQTKLSLSQNYPNPFNPSTTIQYGLPSRSAVRIVIYDVLGRTVSDLVNTEQQAGIQSAVWNANASSGLYFYRLEATSKDDPSKRFVETKKMLLLK